MDEPPSPFFPYSLQPPTDEPPSPLLKSRIPRKTIIVDRNPSLDRFEDDSEFSIYHAHCPLRKGIICYHRDDTIFEHNIHSSGKNEPRIIVPKHPSRSLRNMSFVPIKDNRILLFAKYSAGAPWITPKYLHLSIHEVRSDDRVGSAVWSFNGSVDGRFDIRHLELINSTENELGITFWARFDDHFKLFNISTTETDSLNNFPLIESGRIDFDPKFKLKSSADDAEGFVLLSPDTRILLNVDEKIRRQNETIDVHYLDSQAGSGSSFSFVTRLSTLVTGTAFEYPPEYAFSANGSKFAMAMCHGGVSVWNLQSKVPLQTFTELPLDKNSIHLPRLLPRLLRFSGGNLGKEIMVFVEHDNVSHFEIIHVIDATSFEMEERLFLNGDILLGALFFNPNGRILYAEQGGTIYEWDLQKKEPGPEWWIGEE